MTDANAGGAGEATQHVSIGILAADSEWAQTQARQLPGVEPTFDVSVLPGPQTEALGGLDCLIADRSSAPAATERACRRVSREPQAVSVVLAVEPTADRGALLPEFDPSDVYVKATEQPHPGVLARRVETVLDATRGPDALADHRQSLWSLLSELSTPVAVTAADGRVERTNPAYKAAFGLAEELPAALPDPPADGVRVECETLADRRTFTYATVPFPGGRRCHVLRPLSVDVGTAGLGEPTPSDGTDPLAELTDRQREVLATAHEGGFFERPKAANSDELAATLDITRSTFLQHLRAAERKVFDALLE
jgi:DNA-binding CsgD family transcriptional regulator